MPEIKVPEAVLERFHAELDRGSENPEFSLELALAATLEVVRKELLSNSALAALYTEYRWTEPENGEEMRKPMEAALHHVLGGSE